MGELNVKNRTIFCHDNLEILQGINSGCVDLIYLDPPFNKKKTFTAPQGSSAEGAKFNDIFREKDIKDEWVQTIKEDYEEIHNFLNGIKNIGNHYNYCYLFYMAIRLIEMQRILREAGNIYLHCDLTMSHYLKLLMDCVFGEKNFRNEIIWHYKSGGASKKIFPKKHDTILSYGKYIAQSVHNVIRVPYDAIIPSKYADKFHPEGKMLADVWDINMLSTLSPERTGYPTQKPLALLNRIIKASSNKGDVVLDPFCGCATTCVAAEKLERQWIGIDVSYMAFQLAQSRIKATGDTTRLLRREGSGREAVKMPVIHFRTDPPRRTDRGIYFQDKKYVYVISHKKWKGEYKIGIASDVKRRLNSYQTSDPDRSFKIEYCIHTERYRALERHIHEKFENRHEWVREELQKIIVEMDAYDRQ